MQTVRKMVFAQVQLFMIAMEELVKLLQNPEVKPEEVIKQKEVLIEKGKILKDSAVLAEAKGDFKMGIKQCLKDCMLKDSFSHDREAILDEIM